MNNSSNQSASAWERDLQAESEYLEGIRISIWRYVSPFLLIFGTFGNIMIFVILKRLKLRRSAFPVYFSALAVTALCHLYTGLLPTWIEYVFYFDVYKLNSVLDCRFRNFFQFVFVSSTSWLLALMTVHRATAVLWPHYVHVFCSRRRACMATTIVVVTSMMSCIDSFMGYEEMDEFGKCKYAETEFGYIAKVYAAPFHMIVGFAIPLIIIIYSNIILLRSVMLISLGTVSIQPPIASASNYSGATMRSGSGKQIVSLTRTLLITSSVFICLYLPYFILDIIYPPHVDYVRSLQISPIEKNFSIRRLRLIRGITNQLKYLYAVVNFYLYCISGSHFRSEFISLLRSYFVTSVRKKTKCQAKNPAIPAEFETALHPANR